MYDIDIFPLLFRSALIQGDNRVDVVYDKMLSTEAVENRLICCALLIYSLLGDNADIPARLRHTLMCLIVDGYGAEHSGLCQPFSDDAVSQWL